MRPIHRAAFAAAIALSAITPALAASAADTAQTPAALARSETPEPGDPVAERQVLNEQQAQAAQQQLAQNAANEANYETALAADTTLTRREEARYHAELARHAAQEQQYRAARADWERHNPACRRGDVAKCPPDPMLR